jgi:hypothetical protein
MPPRNPLLIILLVHAALLCTSRAGQTIVDVHCDQVVQPVCNCLRGVCIEDVNHEIYGGLYSQMIFGESFQEPAAPADPEGFKSYGGNWNVRDNTIEIDGSDGPKLVSDHAPFTDGTVSADLMFADRMGQNAGLLLRLNHASIGPDAFTGYEVSVDPVHQSVRLARHRHNFELIKDVPCEVPVGRWFPLQVRLSGPVIAIRVDGNEVLRHDDGAELRSAGTVGLRAWHSRVKYRNLSITTGDRPQSLPFAQISSAGDVSGMWRPIRRGSAIAHFSLSNDDPFVGDQSQAIAFQAGEGEVGISNAGLNHWGLNFVDGKPYPGYVWVRAKAATPFAVALESADGSQIYSEQLLNIAAGDWHRVDFLLTPVEADRNGRFTLKLKSPGSLIVGHVFLQPGSWGRFKDLPVRGDIAGGLINQGVRAIRYGGSMVNSEGYRWKKMIGPRDRRPPYDGTWYKYSSNGWGVIDCLNFCEAAGIPVVPDLNVNESPQDLADFIDYVNGPSDSEWGKRRADDGHSATYHLRYLEIGNEERVDKSYADKFNAIADAVWKKDADITLVAGDFAYTRKITDPDHITGADSRISNMDGQRQILDFARQHKHQVWFDVHVWSEALRPSSNLLALPSYIDAIDKLAKGARHKVVVFELNANSHGQNRALANATAINTICRDNRIPMIISANALQPDGQNDNGWDQGLLFFNPSQVWLQPPGYVTQMQSRNELSNLLRCDVSEASHLDVTAKASANGKAVTLEVVNPGEAESVMIDLQGFTPTASTAKLTVMADLSDKTNTAAEPMRIHPFESDVPLDINARNLAHMFPPHSFSILRFE